jgi:flagellar hook assembly protein FlgD
MRGSATGVEDDFDGALLPTEFALDQNYPNPFNPTTTISYSIGPGQIDHLNLTVYNVLGQEVVTLVDRVQGSGHYAVTWQGTAADGSKAASGIYFYRLTHGDKSETKKMVLLK